MTSAHPEAMTARRAPSPKPPYRRGCRRRTGPGKATEVSASPMNA
jgi:hypothetical protein